MLCCARFIDHVNRLVGQFAVVDIARGQFDGGFDGFIGVADVVMLFEIGFQPHQNFDRILDSGFNHIDFLEPARQGAVLFKMLAEFLIGRGPHATQLAALKRGFEQVGRIHRPA